MTALKKAVDRIAAVGVWPPAVVQFLKNDATLTWLVEAQREAQKSEDEIVLVLTGAMRFLDLTILDGGVETEALLQFLIGKSTVLKDLCVTRRVQANLAERALPILELLGRWSQETLFVIELGCSFGLIGRALVSAEQALTSFDRYFNPTQQRPTKMPRITGYLGVDLSPPERQWLLACIPFAELRSRVARFIDEIPAGPAEVRTGSAFDLPSLGAPPGTIPVVLTSFMLYQLPEDLRAKLKTLIADYTRNHGGTWVNLDVLVHNGNLRFVVEQDGVERMTLADDLGASWTWL